MPIVGANGIDLYYDTFGDEGDPTLLLVVGLGAQCTRYDTELCLGFVDRGFEVIRFDNRDAGLSTHLAPDATYTLADMAADAIGLLDALGRDRVHLWGTSMGGMIAQTIAIAHPERVATLTSVMSNTGEPGYGMPRDDVLEPLLALSTPVDSDEERLDRAMQLSRLIGSPDHFDEDWHRERNAGFIARAYDPAGTGRQMMAVLASGDRAEGLRALDVPTLVIHGDADPLIDISGGRRTAELVPGAELVEVEGMGHDLPPVFWSRYVEVTTRLVAANA